MAGNWLLLALLNKVLNFLAKIFSMFLLKGLIERYLPQYGASQYVAMLLVGVLALAIFLIMTRK